MRGPYDTGRFARVDGLDRVSDRDDVVRIVGQMLDDLQEHPAEWENATLDRFLEALAASLEALPDQVYARRDEQLPTQPTWKVIAEVLVKATGYE